jgi:hypothetical protein
MQEEYEIQLNIPVSYKDMPPDMAFLQSPPSEITARVRDRGSVLLNYTFGQKKASIAVDMQESGGSDNTLRLTYKDIEGIILKQLIPTSNLLSFAPQQIDIPYSKLKHRKLPVYFDGDIRTKPGFLVSGELTVSPPLVDVYAGDVLFESLASLRTVYTEINGADKTITRKLSLRKTEGVVCDPEFVTVTIPIESYTEKTLEIPIRCRQVPPGYALRMFPSVVRVTCNVPLSLFKDLSEKDFEVEVNLVEHELNASGLLSVRLTKKPDWAGRVSLSQDSIEFILEQSR